MLIGSLCLAPLSSCGLAIGHLGTATAASPSTTAVGPAPTFTLTVTPGEAPAGTPFHFRLSGLEPTDVVTFSVAAPGRRPYTGPTHTPAADGSVSATYATWTTDGAGRYVVLAHTATGKGAFATFTVDAAPAATTTSG